MDIAIYLPINMGVSKFYRYCLDVSDQLSATTSLLKKTNNLILKNHIDNCVKQAIKDGDTTKIEEVIKTLEKQI